MVNNVLKIYDDHNDTWCLACDLIEKKGDLYKKRAILLNCFKKDLIPHFRQEEKMFEEMELTEQQEKIVPEIIFQHHKLVSMSKRLAGERDRRKIAKGIYAICTLLKEHIRLEESAVLEQHARNPYRKPFSYPDAGKNAPKEVQAAIERFRAMPENFKRDTPLLYYLLGSGTPPYKMAPEDANYVERSPVKGQKCGNCTFAYKKVTKDNVFICSQISGEISPPAWCRLYESENQ